MGKFTLTKNCARNKCGTERKTYTHNIHFFYLLLNLFYTFHTFLFHFFLPSFYNICDEPRSNCFHFADVYRFFVVGYARVFASASRAPCEYVCALKTNAISKLNWFWLALYHQQPDGLLVRNGLLENRKVVCGRTTTTKTQFSYVRRNCWALAIHLMILGARAKIHHFQSICDGVAQFMSHFLYFKFYKVPEFFQLLLFNSVDAKWRMESTFEECERKMSLVADAVDHLLLLLLMWLLAFVCV